MTEAKPKKKIHIKCEGGPLREVRIIEPNPRSFRTGIEGKVTGRYLLRGDRYVWSGPECYPPQSCAWETPKGRCTLPGKAVAKPAGFPAIYVCGRHRPSAVKRGDRVVVIPPPPKREAKAPESKKIATPADRA